MVHVLLAVALLTITVTLAVQARALRALSRDVARLSQLVESES